jgi:hypothetical protein
MLKLLELDYKIEYKKGKENVVADALSRQFKSMIKTTPLITLVNNGLLPIIFGSSYMVD